MEISTDILITANILKSQYVEKWQTVAMSV